MTYRIDSEIKHYPERQKIGFWISDDETRCYCYVTNLALQDRFGFGSGLRGRDLEGAVSANPASILNVAAGEIALGRFDVDGAVCIKSGG